MSLHYLGKHEPGNCIFSVRHRHVSSPGECGWLRVCGKARGRHFEHLQLTGMVTTYKTSATPYQMVPSPTPWVRPPANWQWETLVKAIYLYSCPHRLGWTQCYLAARDMDVVHQLNEVFHFLQTTPLNASQKPHYLFQFLMFNWSTFPQLLQVSPVLTGIFLGILGAGPFIGQMLFRSPNQQWQSYDNVP